MEQIELMYNVQHPFKIILGYPTEKPQYFTSRSNTWKAFPNPFWNNLQKKSESKGYIRAGNTGCKGC